MRDLYTAHATARGGRIGAVVSDDGVLDLTLTRPEELGGEGGDGTNPEQLFAAGYSACFLSALTRVAKDQGVDVTGSSITADITLGKGDGDAYEIGAVLTGHFPALDESGGQAIMQAAHQVCPYSNATRGNVDVQLRVASS